MVSAQMALAIHSHNKQKRKASAMGVFLNVETQRKFLKLTTAAGLEKELDYATHKYYDLQVQNCDLKNNCLELDGCLRETAALRQGLARFISDKSAENIEVRRRCHAIIEEKEQENEALKEKKRDCGTHSPGSRIISL